ncbi:MAG TPA: hypothetical protein VEN99_08455, partial [Acidimicrobiia bacterium]|nr:hypothetical protein [Acidimicrobiia bacterium]
MPRAIPFLLCVATVLGLSTAATATTTVPNGYDVVTRQELSSGVEYLKLTNPGAPVVAHVAHIAPGAPVDLRVVNAKDKIPTSSRDLEKTSSMCGRVGCIVGVDGDFHTDGAPVGGVISDGRMMRSPNPARPQLTVTRDGHLTAGPLPWSATVVLGDGTRIPVS